jgi:hypothetical protein
MSSAERLAYIVFIIDKIFSRTTLRILGGMALTALLVLALLPRFTNFGKNEAEETAALQHPPDPAALEEIAPAAGK